MLSPFSALTLLLGRQEGRPACKKLCVVLRLDWIIARLIAPVTTTISVILCSGEIQNEDILVPAYPGYPGKCPLNRCQWLECDLTVRIWFQFTIQLNTNSVFGILFGSEANIWHGSITKDSWPVPVQEKVPPFAYGRVHVVKIGCAQYQKLITAYTQCMLNFYIGYVALSFSYFWHRF